MSANKPVMIDVAELGVLADKLAVADELCRVGERVLAAESDKDKTLARARLEEVVAKYRALEPGP